MSTNSCQDLLLSLSSQLSAAFAVDASSTRCRIDTPFLLPDNTLISVFATANPDNTVTLTDDGIASDFDYISGVGPLVLKNRLTQVAVRYGLEITDQTLSTRVHLDALLGGVLSVTGGMQDVTSLIQLPASRRNAKNFDNDIQRFLVRNGWRYARDQVVRGNRGRDRPIDYVVDSGPVQLMMLTFEPGETRSASRRLDEIVVTNIELSNVIQTPRIDLIVLVDDRNEITEAPPTTTWAQTLDDYAHDRVFSWKDRERLAAYLRLESIRA